MLIVFSLDGLDKAEAIIYTPHGVQTPALRPLLAASPPIEPLALLHGLHDLRLSAWRTTAQQLNLGGPNAAQLVRSIKPKYWMATHDEVKIGGGLVSYFLTRKIWQLAEVVGRPVAQALGDVLRTKSEDSEATDEKGLLDTTSFLDLRNGESAVLE